MTVDEAIARVRKYNKRMEAAHILAREVERLRAVNERLLDRCESEYNRGHDAGFDEGILK